uniref:Charged multivesicular body protein 1a n=1 Tax=Chlamydomonas leiostraca TaxID=1034604 RepID=A0A7S0RAB7_9CHLO|mmetsp:Transcript_17575/g.44255  ORF Transcript_17575/g.44255 Transcript_17575/m.44255 type:complete len:202 (+) Transcript_17575:228-833(+)|eukprot:CAMPEP_0202867900 /NCGR_PEP_ID=MMETSP1391-20130828/9707_1 /ASSEMBLY_ACC=CAM_ASM_000867 /TAXON_ID=1034604 /ORGANISM="Chlamydomonas leiostraca, Strain SAG 11-49" /LENGTH=201 /DNA_ID=CAMNT_0049547981 /DNA_START=250 /DNA_END=855 /DNA_ORIENTATION=-
MGGDKLLDQIFNLKFTAKQLARSAVKCEKEEKAERLKVKKAIEKGNMEGAKIYAQNAIRKKNEQLNYMKLASRLDAVVSRLDTQAKMQMVNKSMASIVGALEKSLASNNLEKIAATMNQFERQFENLDLQTQVVDEVMGAQANLSTPEDDVTALIQQVADEHNLDVALNMAHAPTAAAPSKAGAKAGEEDLGARLAELRGK